MRKLSILLNLAFIAILFSSCNPSEKEVKVKDVALTGFSKKYIKVVDGTYKFTNNDTEAFITVKFELKEKPEQEVCTENGYPELRINAIGENGSIFDTGTYGFVATDSELDKLIELMKDGKVGEQKSISFIWNYYGVSKDEGVPIFKSALSFEVIDKAFALCSEITKEDNSSVQASESENEDWDAVLKSYESYIDQYIKLMKKANNGDASAMTEYASMMEKATDLSEKMENAGDKLSTAQMNKFLKLQTKLANSALEIK